MIERYIDSEAAMHNLGAQLAQLQPRECMIYLEGDLGVGKTTFVRGLLRAIGIKGPIKSPTYTIIEPYIYADWSIYHIDLYRIADPNELLELGVRDWLEGGATCLVEWPALGGQVLPPADIVMQFDYDGEARKVRFEAQSLRGQRIISALPRL